ncbi:MAG: ABC-F family ATP-binding cassette domain-containing protein [Candidatus Omnitrophica bacterium]|nr:ABC-F family ATP-binding cassette domain-containing protein [Candidatus Omnitrophota bacterium]
MISISNLSKNYGKKVLFNNLNLSINRGEKIGLIGPNGSGKSTLFSMILQENEPTSGNVQVNKGTRIGYLPQESSFKSEHTVLSELTEGDETVMRLKKEKYQLETDNQAGSERYGEILHELEALGYFELEHKAKKILSGLGFKESDFNRPVTDLSGGWQMRTLLGKLLTFNYDLLLLDEPTNYLDLNAALWLKEYLAQFRGTFLMISHDKAFLNEVTNYTLILENGSIFKVHGNYEHYEQIKDQKRTFLLRQFKEQEKKRKQLEEFVARFHAQPNKASQVKAKRSELERMEEIVLIQDPRESIRDFHFPQTRKSGHRVVNLHKVSKSYGTNQVYNDFDFELTQGQKAVLAGENGAGKSTLLKILAGVIDIDSGERIIGHHVEVGYFSQTRTDVLNLENTVLEEAYSAAPGLMSQETIRTILGAFLFTGDDADKRVKVLSGGEKSRLILAKLLIKPPNFLLLDEPTTHLDVDAVDALIKALTEYEGTIVFISHDIHFVRSVANTVFEVKEGRAKSYPGNFDYYLEKKRSGDEEYAPAQQKVLHDKVSHPGTLKKQHDLASKEEERSRKAQNALLKDQIKQITAEREKLNLERLSKSRAISNPRGYRDDASLEEYILRVEELQSLMAKMNDQVRALKKQIKDNP